METEELYSINISPLVTIPFATQWSPDNQISIITERGVHIFEFEPTPMSPNSTIRFARSFINPPDTLPTYVSINEINPSMWNMEHEEIYSLLMEEMITPKLDGTNDRLPRIVRVAWSPKNLISPSQCALAIVSAAGTVNLLHKVSNEWYSICDVSSLWLDIVQDQIEPSLDKYKKSSDLSYATITESMRRLQVCSVTWSKLLIMKEETFAYFSVAHCSGDVSIWKIPRVTNFSKSLQPKLVGRIDSNVRVKINVLCWITINANKHLLVVGYIDGRIRAVKLTRVDNDLQVASTEQYIDPDCVTIDYLDVISQDKSNLKILATKGSFLLLLCVNLKGVLQNMRYLQVPGFNITGVVAIAPQQFLISTQEKRILAVDVQLDELISINVKSHLPQTHVQYLGLARSPNKVIFLNITSPNMIYDHLVMREPSTMHIFSLKGTTWDPLFIINNSTDLANVWDCMEVLRLKAVKAEDSTTVLCPSPQTLESSSLYSLQVSMWMTIMTTVSTTKKTISNINHVKEGKMTQALPLISVHSTCRYLDCLTEKDALSEENLLAVSLLRNYLKMYLASENGKSEGTVHRRARKALSAVASYPDRVETCNLCNETINEPWNAKSCPRGHKLPRCTTTLLQVTSLEYRVCPICGQLFHRCLEEVYEEPRCQLCDVPILHNPYAFDVDQYKFYGTNLSRLHVNVAESSREPEELQNSSENEPTSKWHTSRSIIVKDDDDDDDESDRITERWEEF
ncbi:hypothetical protein DMN91_003070 [Ooceraea biroi]|uniref:Transcription factor IIIC 90kDa subunit N-terminal domain-containing protein n=1 Tax=Ooceraea biroi TaxID=2015173 RepID=A0A026WNM9_OOCBI|nr:uncharacterized protein LOC105276850 [Ooceraea biroi]EZA57652.1 hypothetical protein X777_00752 [Ooceraea biroi]RLU24978.1 hypothetical protein DMN91_003070 [Ooceraea biroi]